MRWWWWSHHSLLFGIRWARDLPSNPEGPVYQKKSRGAHWVHKYTVFSFQILIIFSIKLRKRRGNKTNPKNGEFRKGQKVKADTRGRSRFVHKCEHHSYGGPTIPTFSFGGVYTFWSCPDTSNAPNARTGSGALSLLEEINDDFYLVLGCKFQIHRKSLMILENL